MEQSISRTEKKRQAKVIESLAQELVKLPVSEIGHLPCDSFLKKEIIEAKKIKGGARQRQVKYITKNLRNLDCKPFFSFLHERKGSKLQEKKLFHDLEYMRDQILEEAFEAQLVAERDDQRLDSHWQCSAIEAVHRSIPQVDSFALKTAAIKFVVTRKPVHKREIFRLLKTAKDRMDFIAQKPDSKDLA